MQVYLLNVHDSPLALTSEQTSIQACLIELLVPNTILGRVWKVVDPRNTARFLLAAAGISRAFPGVMCVAL